MLSVPLVLFRGGDKTRFSKAPAKLDWLGQLVVGLGTHFAALGELQRLSMETSVSDIRGSKQEKLVECSGKDQERPASSPCPSSSSSDDSSSSAGSPSSSSDSSDSSNNSSDSEEEAPLPPANFGNGGGGNGGDDEKKKKDEEEDGNNSDSSSSDSSADESDQEEDDGVMIDTDDEKDKVNNGVDPTDDDLSDESDGSSDLENSYPRLPSAPVDTLIAFRQQAAQKELQMTEKLKKEVIEDAKQRLQDRQQSQRSKKKKKSPQSKRRQSKHSNGMSNGPTHFERHHTNGSTGITDAKEGAEDEWVVDCSCGLKEKNYDDGTSMIQCDSCSHWVHAKCADKQPEAVAQEKFMCFQCSWMFDCVCDVRQRPNHDDGQRMVECESCKTWQHTMCVGIPMTEEPADDYQCPRCVRKARRRKSASNGSRSRDDRQRKRRHSEQSLHRRKSKDASAAVAVDVRSAARSIENLTTPTRAHRSRRTEPKESPKMERKTPLSSPPPVPAVSPPSSPPPPPSTPPPPANVSGSSRHDRSHSRSKRKSERSSASSSSSNRKRGRSLGSSPSSSKKEHSVDREDHDSPSAGVKPSPRGKGLMLRGYSPAAKTETSLSRSVDVRPSLPLTPRSGSDHSYSSHTSGGRKRKTSSARDRLAKKLKIKKSSLR